MNKMKKICVAYLAGRESRDTYLDQYRQNVENPYSSALERDEYEAWNTGNTWYIIQDKEVLPKLGDTKTYHLISYRVIKASGSIFYHYALVDYNPEDWLVEKFIETEGKDHYSIQNVLGVNATYYTSYKDVFNKEVVE